MVLTGKGWLRPGDGFSPEVIPPDRGAALLRGIEFTGLEGRNITNEEVQNYGNKNSVLKGYRPGVFERMVGALYNIQGGSGICDR